MKKRYKRFVSFLTATVMFCNLLPIDELGYLPLHLPKLPSFSTASTIKANALTAEQFTPGQITFNTASDFVDYCSYYADDNCTVSVPDPEDPDGDPVSERFAEAHQNDILFLTFPSDDNATRGTIPSGFIGLGNDDVPFNGEIHLPDNGLGYFKITTYGSPLFSYVNDSVKILSGSKIQDTNGNDYYPNVRIQFNRLSDVGSGENNPLFAQHITDGTAASADWDVELVSSNSCTYSGVIGDIASDAVANLTFTNSSGEDIVSNTNVGAVCGTMYTGSTLNLSFSETSSAYTIRSASGNAGGLVGVMNGTSTLNISAMPNASAAKSIVAAAGYAGGLVGSATSQATISYASA